MQKEIIFAFLLGLSLNASFAQTSVVKTVNNVEFTMIPVAGGTFKMGSDVETFTQPIHSVTVKGFILAETEVTQKLWHAVMGTNPSYFNTCDECPVEKVSWNDVQDFLTKLNALTGEMYRLPTEAEWEYAARGGKNSKGYTYSGSNTLDDVAWHYGNNELKTHPVKSKTANELGFYDMSGNVWEWCQDWWHDDYKGAPNDGSAWTKPTGDRRVYRGGCWFLGGNRCPSFSRNARMPDFKEHIVGFRLALSSQ